MLTLLLACRPEVGAPDYPEPDAVSFGDEDSLYAGPDPYEEGEDRLSLGVFYESGYSELLAVDDASRFYYIYDNTYSEEVDLQDRVEGRSSTILVAGSAGWFGGGIHWSSGSLADWTTLNVSFRSSDAGFDDFEIRMNGGLEGGVFVGDYGYVNDGQWSHLSIPTADFEAAGVNLETITVAFMLIGEGVAEGEELKIDNLYFTAE